MHMIGKAADFLRNTVELFDNSTQEGMQPGTPRCGNQADAIFRTKNQVIMQGQTG